MRILDVNNKEVLSPDYNLGYTIQDKLFIKHHDAVEAVEEQGHYEVIAEYDNGGQDVEWRIDVPGVEAKDTWDEYEDILRYIEYTKEELEAIEAERNKPTQLDAIESQVYYTAMKTGTLIKAVV